MEESTTSPTAKVNGDNKHNIKKIFTKANLKHFALMNFGTLLSASSFYFFKKPNSLTTGGVSGIGIILNTVLPNWPMGGIITGLNVLLLLLGFLFLGKKLGASTVYCTLLFSGYIWGMEYLVPITQPLIGDTMLELFIAAIGSAAAASILFYLPASTGGTDIITLIVKKYTTFNTSMCMMLVEFGIALFSGFAIGWKKAAYSMMCLLIQVAAVSVITDLINYKKQVTIITTKPQGMCDYITNTLHRGATVVRGMGGYTGELKYIVYTIVSATQAVDLKKVAKEIDATCFFMTTKTSDILGKGFRQSALDFADDKAIVTVPKKPHHAEAQATAHHAVPNFDDIMLDDSAKHNKHTEDSGTDSAARADGE